MFCDYIFYFDLSLEGMGTTMGLTCTICGEKKKPSYELSVCLWCFGSQRGVFGVVFIFFLSQTKQKKAKKKKQKKKKKQTA